MAQHATLPDDLRSLASVARRVGRSAKSLMDLRRADRTFPPIYNVGSPTRAAWRVSESAVVRWLEDNELLVVDAQSDMRVAWARGDRVDGPQAMPVDPDEEGR